MAVNYNDLQQQRPADYVADILFFKKKKTAIKMNLNIS